MACIDLVKDRHNKMITMLSDYIGALINLEEFKQFKNRLKGVLPPLIFQNATNIMEISDALEKKGLIAPGEYNYLKKVVVDFNVSIVRGIIEPAEVDIKKMKSTKESQCRSDTGNDVLESKRRILHSILC
jgi:fumarylacetoacetate (FAA) hydrolase family protein